MFNNKDIKLEECKDIAIPLLEWSKFNQDIKTSDISYENIQFGDTWTFTKDGTYNFASNTGTATLLGETRNLVFKLRILTSHLREDLSHTNHGRSSDIIKIGARKNEHMYIDATFQDTTTNTDITGSMQFNTYDLDNDVGQGGLFGHRWEGVKETSGTRFLGAKENTASTVGTPDPTGKWFRKNSDGYYSGWEQTAGFGRDLMSWEHTMSKGWNHLIDYKSVNTTNLDDYFLFFDLGTIKTNATHKKIHMCKQYINVEEYKSNCSGEDCNYKLELQTRLFRTATDLKDGSKLYSNWTWLNKNLVDVKDKYKFDGNNVVGLETDFPWILEGSYRTNLNKIKIYLYSDCCTSCGEDCEKKPGFKYELKVPNNFRPRNCFEKEPFKVWTSCLKVDRPHWVVTESKTESNLCNWTAHESNCQVLFNYYNKQQLKDYIREFYSISYDLEDFLKSHSFGALNKCGAGSILNTNSKTIFGAISQLQTKYENKQNKHENLTLLSETPLDKIKKL